MPRMAASIATASRCAPDYAGSDIERKWGKRRSAPRDYIFDRPVLLGKMRMGPDLANVGKRPPPVDEGAAGDAAPSGANAAPAHCSSADRTATSPAAAAASPAPSSPAGASPAPRRPRPRRCAGTRTRCVSGSRGEIIGRRWQPTRLHGCLAPSPSLQPAQCCARFEHACVSFPL